MALLLLGSQQGTLIPLLLSLELGDLGWPHVFAEAEKHEWVQETDKSDSQILAYTDDWLM